MTSFFNDLKSEITDKRIIFLDNDTTNAILPPSFRKTRITLNMTLCAGDGVQFNGNNEVTDIEWFTRRIEGYGRNEKPTHIFCTTVNYNEEGLKKNIAYLESKPSLDILLLLYDDTNDAYLDALVRLFTNKINNIFEDFCCYCKKLNLYVLYNILKHNGTYKFDGVGQAIKLKNDWIDNYFSLYQEYTQYFTIDLKKNIITKNNGDEIIYNINKNNYFFQKINEHYKINKINEHELERERIRLNELNEKYRKEYKFKKGITSHISCKCNSNCKLLGKNGVCDENICYFDANANNKRLANSLSSIYKK